MQLPRCNFSNHQYTYLEGQWKDALSPLFPETFTNQSRSEWLERFAYNYQDKCNAETFRCHVYEPNNCRIHALDIVKYQWIPRNCYLEDFDPLRVDRAMRNKTVLFIGDSLMRQQFNSWRFLMRSVWADKKEAMYEEQFHTVNGAHYIFAWGKFLAADREERLLMTGDAAVDPDMGWAQLLLDPNQRVDVVMMNVGHHWHKADTNFDHYTAMIDSVLDYLKQHFEGRRIIFRTSAVGHYGCGEDGDMLSRPIDVAPVLQESTDKYNWRKPIVHERVWMQRAELQGLDDRFLFLNVSQSQNRPDAHQEYNIRNGRRGIDCLHWCLPGVPGKL